MIFHNSLPFASIPIRKEVSGMNKKTTYFLMSLMFLFGSLQQLEVAILFVIIYVLLTPRREDLYKVLLAGASGGIIPLLHSLQDVKDLVFSSQAAVSARTQFPVNILFFYDRFSGYIIMAVSAILFIIGIVYMVRALLQKDLQNEQAKEGQA
jgi:hypothetical protein